MEIIVGKTAGFCYGVQNAVSKAISELEKGGSLNCLGELVHNKQVTERLKQMGLSFVDNINEAKHKTIIRAHGVEKATYEMAKKNGIDLIDLTCPKVLKIHSIAEEFSNNNYYIFLVGDKNHPEIIGTASFCGEKYTIIEKEEDIIEAITDFQKSEKEKVLLIAQTTYSLEKFDEICKIVSEQINKDKVEIKNTICNATKQRQEETQNIAKQVDLMIVIGSKNSSNSNKLYDISKKFCSKILFIETKDEIQEDIFKGINKVGIMAGASTPNESIQEVIEKISKM